MSVRLRTPYFGAAALRDDPYLRCGGPASRRHRAVRAGGGVARALDAVGGLDGPVGKRDKHSVETDLAPPPEHRLAPLFAGVHVGWLRSQARWR